MSMEIWANPAWNHPKAGEELLAELLRLALRITATTTHAASGTRSRDFVSRISPSTALTPSSASHHARSQPAWVWRKDTLNLLHPRFSVPEPTWHASPLR